MGRPRKPTIIHEIKGSYKKDPQRRRDSEPKPSGSIGAFVENRSKDKEAVWNELTEACVDGVLTDMDAVWLEVTVDLLILHRSGEITTGDRAQLLKLLSGIGFNPVDRSRIGIKEKEKVNRFKEVM